MTAWEGYPVIRSPDMTLPREPPFQFLRRVERVTRVATLPCVRARLWPRAERERESPQWGSASPPRVTVSHKRRKIEGRVTSVLCNLSLRVRVRPTATARREFWTAISLSLNYSLTRVSRGDGKRERGEESIRAKITTANGEEPRLAIRINKGRS